MIRGILMSRSGPGPAMMPTAPEDLEDLYQLTGSERIDLMVSIIGHVGATLLGRVPRGGGALEPELVARLPVPRHCLWRRTLLT